MKLRMQITKEKEIRFISHLEYVRTIERAIRRAKLPAAYSEGFNPHLKFSLASALGVGVVSMAEFVEIELAEPMEVHEAVQSQRCGISDGKRHLQNTRQSFRQQCFTAASWAKHHNIAFLQLYLILLISMIDTFIMIIYCY